MDESRWLESEYMWKEMSMGEITEARKQEIIISMPIEQNPAAVYLARLGSEYSRYGMRWCLSIASTILTNGRYEFHEIDWSKLRYQHIAALRARLMQPSPTPKRKKPYAYRTANMILSGVRGVMKEAWKLGHIEDSDYLRIMAVEMVKGDSLPAGRAITGSEMEALFETCRENGGVAGIRDICMMAILFGAGLRRTEVTDLDYRDWHEEESVIIVRRGKGRKAREIPIGHQVNRAIADWIRLRGRDDGALFFSTPVGDRIIQRRLRPEAVYSMLQRRCEDAGVEPISSHDCRRTYITNLLQNGNDLATTAKLAGHKSVDTTARYDRRGMDSLRAAAESLVLPVLK
jgi:integrase